VSFRNDQRDPAGAIGNNPVNGAKTPISSLLNVERERIVSAMTISCDVRKRRR
jgi:hypothetical protein